MKTRFFSFGCSFTRYRWPTWADIIGREFQEFENWGDAGAGNHFIFYSLLEAIARKNINQDDTVGIMWTATHREDRFLRGKWHPTGSIYCSSYPKEYIDNWTDSTHYLLTSITLIAAAKKILDSIGCRYWFFSMVPINDTLEPASKKVYSFLPEIESEIIELYQPALSVIHPSVYEIIFGGNWSSRNHVPMPGDKKAIIDMFRKDYEMVAASGWPTFQDFLDNRLCSIDPAVIDQLDKKFDFFARRDLVLHERPNFHPVPSEHAEYLDKLGFELSQNQRAFVQYWDNRVATKEKFVWMHQPFKRL